MQDLQPPGMGLPVYESNLLGFILKMGAAVSSDIQILSRFQRESDLLVQLYEDDESYDVFQEKLIPRVLGIEDSSRNWSVAMVLDHLTRTNHEMGMAVDALARGIIPHGEVDVALYKPDPGVTIDVVDRFLAVNQTYIDNVRNHLESLGRLPTESRFRHPWFGPLNAHQWHQLAASHQWIHRRQVQKIIAMLGVT